ncbi:hypothetical protein [Brumicola pallidula]|jgi:hypothetical protein|uniref:Uncharacterized protein n=1 Tax=Brumicola pallidula DSM 14239 = ACAM 615 TaxID=1121922 RepID=K6YTW4_9ALTE|nr:hypothetical protein [Glaciecola pallidula]GAC27381.1 hypothetical protein GPAL_0501 [Glaciecola pallidula DSM 14239 = ACAM 615]
MKYFVYFLSFIALLIAYSLFGTDISEKNSIVIGDVGVETTNVEEPALQNNSSYNINDSKIETEGEDNNTFDYVFVSSKFESHILDLYINLSDNLYGGLYFNNIEEYKILVKNGLPLEKELEYLSESDYSQTAIKLAESRINSTPFEPNEDLSTSALSSANLVRTIVELEKSIQYYIPNYTIGDKFPEEKDWPSGYRPEVVASLMKDLVYAQASVDKSSPVAQLALAKFTELNFYGLESDELMLSVFEHITNAQVVVNLQSISQYIAENYPNQEQKYIAMLEEKRRDSKAINGSK